MIQTRLSRVWARVSLLGLSASVLASASAWAADDGPSVDLITPAVVQDIMDWLSLPVVRISVAAKNETSGSFSQADIDALDDQWEMERGREDQPLITAVLASPLSNYLLRIQAQSLGLYAEIFVMSDNGLNVGQSAITSDYWQGDEAKFQKTYAVGPDTVFIDAPEFHDGTGTWRSQVNMTLTDDTGRKIGAATVELNLTELSRRAALVR